MPGVAEGFCSAAARGGECACEVAVPQTFGDLGAANELMQETGVETVAGADGVYRGDFRRHGLEDF